MKNDNLNETETISVDDAVHRIGVGKFQRQVLFATGTCFMADSLQVILVSILSRKLQKLWLYDDSTTSTIMSCLFIGATAGSVVLGPLADRIGRKPVLLYSAGIIALFGLLMALCSNYIELLPAVLCVGIGIGGLTVPFDILAEFLPTHNRGYYLLSIKYFWTVGSMLAPLLAYISFELADSWRLFCIISVVPSVLSFITGMQVVPESPRWLVSKGRKDEAMYVLRKAAEINGLDPYEVLPEGCELEDSEAEEADIMELFTVSLFFIYYDL
jgi:MFS family permease